MSDESTGVGSTPAPEDTVGERIKEARQRPAYDLSIEALSRLCREYDVQGQGITATTLLRYEQGKVKPGAREIRILCSALDISADWLVFGAENPQGLSLEEGLKLLANLIYQQEQSMNPFKPARRGMDLIKAEKVRLAKVPQKRD